MRSELEESRGREKKAVEALDAMKSATASRASATASKKKQLRLSIHYRGSYSSYPDALNPFSPAQASPQPSSSASTPWQQPAAADEQQPFRLPSELHVVATALTAARSRASHSMRGVRRIARCASCEHEVAAAVSSMPCRHYVVRLLGQEALIIEQRGGVHC